MTARKPKPDMPCSHKIVLRIVLDAGAPVDIKIIAAKAGFTQSHTGAVLRKLRDRGLVGPTRTGAQACWTLAEAAKAERERASAERQQRLASRDALRVERARLACARRAASTKALAEATAHDAWADEPPIRRVVPAHECQPLRLRAPASVFHLAHCA